MKFLSTIEPITSLKVGGAEELLDVWIKHGLPDVADQVYDIRIIKNSRYYLEGFIVFVPLKSEDKSYSITSRFYFKLIAQAGCFSRNNTIRHFVSRLDPVDIRKEFPILFLKMIMPWLKARGYSAVHFPIHSRKRCSKFQSMLNELGVHFHVLNRLLFQTIVVDLNDTYMPVT